MKFEELSTIWNSVDFELDNTIQINKQLVKDLGLTQVKSKLTGLKWTILFQIIAETIFLNFLIGFIVQNYAAHQFSIPASILLVTTIFSLAFEIYQLWLSSTIDSNLTVVEAQKKLARLQMMEILDMNSLYIIIPLFSAPFMIVASKAFLNMNLYELGANWWIYFTIGSVVVAALIVFFLKMFPNKELIESVSFLNELKENE